MLELATKVLDLVVAVTARSSTGPLPVATEPGASASLNIVPRPIMLGWESDRAVGGRTQANFRVLRHALSGGE